MAIDPKDRERRIKAVMSLANISRQEAIKVIQDDEKIDRGERCDWEDDEYTQAQTLKAVRPKIIRTEHTAAYGQRKNRTPDNIKRELLEKIKALIDQEATDVQIINAERTIEFKIGDDSYAIDLKKHRKPV